jgi:hypothetical protein
MWWRWGESNQSIKDSCSGVFIVNFRIRVPTRVPKNKTVYFKLKFYLSG